MSIPPSLSDTVFGPHIDASIAKNRSKHRRRSVLPDKSQGNDAPSRVRVAVRLRPPFESEVSWVEGSGDQGQGSLCHPHYDFHSAVKVSPLNPDGRSQRVSVTLDPALPNKEFTFDRVFCPEDTASSGLLDDRTLLYDTMCRDVVQGCLQGINGTIMAYGQTGTGKTFTMGMLEKLDVAQGGIVPISLRHVLESLAQYPLSQWSVKLSFVQIYMEQVYDLLDPPLAVDPHATPAAAAAAAAKNASLAIREDPASGVYVDGAMEISVRRVEEAFAVVNDGLYNRALASTNLNSTSSRSHTILIAKISRRQTMDDSGVQYSATVRGNLMLVDLAGSECVKKARSKGVRLHEAKAINISLSALGNVVAALSTNQTSAITKHVPFRDSKLTRLLQDGLGGGANTLLVATIGPCTAHVQETISTLTFASRCLTIASQAVVHEEVDYVSLCRHLTEKVKELERVNSLSQCVSHASTSHVSTSLSLPYAPLQSPPHLVNAAVDDNLSLLGHVVAVLETVCACAVTTQASNAVREKSYAIAQQRVENEELCRRQEEHTNRDSMSLYDRDNGYGRVASSSGPVLPLAIARQHVDTVHGASNNAPPPSLPLHTMQCANFYTLQRPSESPVTSPDVWIKYCSDLGAIASGHVTYCGRLMEVKDRHYHHVKQALVEAELEKSRRDGELRNWSAVLNGLLSANRQLKHCVDGVSADSERVATTPSCPCVIVQPHLTTTNHITHADRIAVRAATMIQRKVRRWLLQRATPMIYDSEDDVDDVMDGDKETTAIYPPIVYNKRCQALTELVTISSINAAMGVQTTTLDKLRPKTPPARRRTSATILSLSSTKENDMPSMPSSLVPNAVDPSLSLLSKRRHLLEKELEKARQRPSILQSLDQNSLTTVMVERKIEEKRDPLAALARLATPPGSRRPRPSHAPVTASSAGHQDFDIGESTVSVGSLLVGEIPPSPVPSISASFVSINDTIHVDAALFAADEALAEKLARADCCWDDDFDDSDSDSGRDESTTFSQIDELAKRFASSGGFLRSVRSYE